VALKRRHKKRETKLMDLQKLQDMEYSFAKEDHHTPLRRERDRNFGREIQDKIEARTKILKRQ
jgi:hypothetical protein